MISLRNKDLPLKGDPIVEIENLFSKASFPVLDKLVFSSLAIFIMVLASIYFNTLEVTYYLFSLLVPIIMSHMIGKWLCFRNDVWISNTRLTIGRFPLKRTIRRPDLESYALVKYANNPVKSSDNDGNPIEPLFEEAESWKELIVAGKNRIFSIRSLSHRKKYYEITRSLTRGLRKMTADELDRIFLWRRKKGIFLIAASVMIFLASFFVGERNAGPLKTVRGTVGAVPSVTANDDIHILLQEYPYCVFTVSGNSTRAMNADFFTEVKFSDHLEIEIPLEASDYLAAGNPETHIPVYGIRHNHGTFLYAEDCETQKLFVRKMIWLVCILPLIPGYRLIMHGSTYGKRTIDKMLSDPI